MAKGCQRGFEESDAMIPQSDIDWRGETSCVSYRGIKRNHVRSCCGGKAVTVYRIDCKIHSVSDSDCTCRRDVCEYFKEQLK